MTGRTGECLHTMAVMQAHQADILKALDEGEKPIPHDIAERRTTADLRNLWLYLLGMKEKDRVFLLDAQILPSGLFGDAVNTVVDWFLEV